MDAKTPGEAFHLWMIERDRLTSIILQLRRANESLAGRVHLLESQILKYRLAGHPVNGFF